MGAVKGEVSRDYFFGLLRQISDLPPEPKVEERKPMHKITEKQARILDYLIEFGWCTKMQIELSTGIKNSTVNSAFDELLKRGYVERRKARHRENGIEWGVTELGRQAAITPQSWAMEG